MTNRTFVRNAVMGSVNTTQEPITRSEQIPCARVTEFLRTSLFLERFFARISRGLSIVQQTPCPPPPSPKREVFIVVGIFV